MLAKGLWIDVRAGNGCASVTVDERVGRGLRIEPRWLLETPAIVRPGGVSQHAAISDTDDEVGAQRHPTVPEASSIGLAVPPAGAWRIGRHGVCQKPTMCLDTLLTRHVGIYSVDFLEVDARPSEVAMPWARPCQTIAAS